MSLPMTASGIGVLVKRIETHVKERGIASAAAAATVLESYVKVELSQPGSGRFYGAHQASCPGEPPAPNQGVLRGSVHTEQLPNGDARVIVDGPGAMALELGAPERGLLPRPYMRPSIRKARPAMHGAMLRAQVKGLRAVRLAPRDVAIAEGFSGS